MRTVLIFAAMIAASLAAHAEGALTLAPLSSPAEGSIKPGAQASAKAGDVIYWEDERTIPVAITSRPIDEGSKFFGNNRSLPDGARLRKATYGGQEFYCAVDDYSVERMHGDVLCLVDADGDKAFETSKRLTISRSSKPGNIVIAADSTDKIEPALPYRVENAYPSVAGFRAVIKYIGIKDGQFVLSCALEPKTEMPPGLKRLMLHGRETPAVQERSFPAPVGAPVDVTLPLCFTNTALDFLKGIPGGEQFVDPHTLGERPVALQISRADAQGMQFRLVRPFAGWIIAYDQGPKDTGSMSFQQEEK